MDVTKIPDPPGYAELSTAEKVDYIQLLWDRLFEEGDDLPVPESHMRIVEERRAAYHRGESQVRSAFAIFDELTKDEK